MQITREIPQQYLVDVSPGGMGRRIQFSAALFLFQWGEMSAGAAAEFATVDRLTFAAECQRRGISVVDYPAEEPRAEFESLRRRAS